MQTIEQIYQQYIKPIPVNEQQRLIKLITENMLQPKANKSPWQALQDFRNSTNLEALNIDTHIFDKDRKNIQERQVNL